MGYKDVLAGAKVIDDIIEMESLKRQTGGSHYISMKIQPVEYILLNRIPFVEGCIIKYISRWRIKGGMKDLEKARHFLDILIEYEEKKEGEKLFGNAPFKG